MEDRNLAPKLPEPLNFSSFRCPINGDGCDRMRRDGRLPAILSAQMQEPQAGTMLSRVYRPPREIGSTQSRWSGRSAAPQ